MPTLRPHRQKYCAGNSDVNRPFRFRPGRHGTRSANACRRTRLHLIHQCRMACCCLPRLTCRRLFSLRFSAGGIMTITAINGWRLGSFLRLGKRPDRSASRTAAASFWRPLSYRGERLRLKVAGGRLFAASIGKALASRLLAILSCKPLSCRQGIYISIYVRPPSRLHFSVSLISPSCLSEIFNENRRAFFFMQKLLPVLSGQPSVLPGVFLLPGYPSAAVTPGLLATRTGWGEVSPCSNS